MKTPLTLIRLALAVAVCGAIAGADGADSIPAYQLLPAVQTTSAGVLLSEILSNPPADLPQTRLVAAPAAGQAITLTRAQIIELARQAAPGLTLTNWAGAAQVRVTRRMRAFEEEELKTRLSALLQQDYVKDRGELELRFTRPWTTLSIPDEACDLKILDMPSTGVSANLILRFELRRGREVFGQWQVVLQSKIWREVLVTRSGAHRGQLLNQADVVRERRDILSLRDTVDVLPTGDDLLEMAENLPAGTALTPRSLRLRPVVMRGQLIDGVVQDGTLNICLKVEVLEDGAPGQMVRVRNPQTRRELRGKVQNEQTVLIPL